MSSHPIGYIALDQSRLENDLRMIETFDMSDAYSEYAVGAWTTCVLMNMTGNKDDGLSREYEGVAQLTEYGKRTPYLAELICCNFQTAPLRSVRIFAAQNGFIIPHRDYLEFKKGFTRLHVVLLTHDRCLNSEGAFVYHMRRGEVWFVDGHIPHSGGSFSGAKRLHLILDFDPDIPIGDLLKRSDDFHSNLRPALIKRQPISDQELDALVISLSRFLSDLTYDTVFQFIAKLHFDRELDCGITYDLMLEIATRSGKEPLLRKAIAAKEYYLGSFVRAS